MEIVVHRKKSVSKKFHKRLYHFSRNTNTRVWWKKWSSWASAVGQKKRLRVLVLIGIRLHPTPPRLRNLVSNNHSQYVSCISTLRTRSEQFWIREHRDTYINNLTGALCKKWQHPSDTFWIAFTSLNISKSSLPFRSSVTRKHNSASYFAS